MSRPKKDPYSIQVRDQFVITREQQEKHRKRGRERYLKGVAERLRKKLHLACEQLIIQPDQKKLATDYLEKVLETDGKILSQPHTTNDYTSIVAIIFLSYREIGTPASIGWIRKVLGKTSKNSKLTRAARKIVKLIEPILGLATPTTIEGWVNRIADKMELSDSFREQAVKQARAISGRSPLRGPAPSSLAAALVWLLSLSDGQKLSQIPVARAAGVTEASLRTNYKRIMQFFKVATGKGGSG